MPCRRRAMPSATRYADAAALSATSPRCRIDCRHARRRRCRRFTARHALRRMPHDAGARRAAAMRAPRADDTACRSSADAAIAAMPG
jgi:hypothetical protein